MKSVIIVGGGWYGCHIAIALKKLNYEVVILEQNDEILSQISGNFGIRIHAGPHYPRSKKTRESCQNAFHQFIAAYPELVVQHDYSRYALGTLDTEQHSAKISLEEFRAVCNEVPNVKNIEIDSASYHDLLGAWDVYEPSIVVGDLLRSRFKPYLVGAGVTVVCNFQVQSIEQVLDSMQIMSDTGQIIRGDYIINATGYQSFSPSRLDLPFKIEVIYQPCLALLYQDLKATERPFSFTVMDGLFPSLIPYCDSEKDTLVDEITCRKYILYHCKYHIMGSFITHKEASQLLAKLDDQFIESSIKPASEAEINRFWPEFEHRFQYIGWKGSVLAKLKTEKDFRSAITFEKDNVIHVIPGKISNIFDAEREVVALLSQENILKHDGYSYMKHGVLDSSMTEITEIPELNAKSIYNLQTYNDLVQHINEVLSAPKLHSFWKTLPNQVSSEACSTSMLKPA